MKILFQGDSVTDAGRDRSHPNDMGDGYPRYASAMLRDAFPDADFEFINLGISGNRTEDLVSRLESDFIDVRPDIVSILIGINDVWHHYSNNIETTDEQFEDRYRSVLEAIKTRTNAKIMMMEPFLIGTPCHEDMPGELTRKQAIIRELADTYADIFVPLDEILHTEVKVPLTEYSTDGVHPTPDGACYIGEVYLRAITPLVELLSKEDD